MNDDPLLRGIGELVGQLQMLQPEAVKANAPVVEEILRTGSRDVKQIEDTMDGLLDFGGFDPALQLYRRLCRHYWEIDPAATASYVAIYREHWDSDKDQENE